MERGSDKHNPRVDDELRHQTDSLLGGAPVESRAEEWREQEGPAEGEPTPDSRLRGGRPGSDTGPDPDEVEGRAELARHLHPSVFPARTGELVEKARDAHAPDGVVEKLEQLPDQLFENIAAVWEALGGHTEYRRHGNGNGDGSQSSST